MRAIKMTALLLVVGAAVLVPLYGDSRAGTVTHPEWARMLVRALEMEGALPQNAAPAQVFSALSWKGSLTFSADHYQSATGIAQKASGGTPTAVAAPSDGEIVYPLLVITGGDYRVRARLSGRPERVVVAEMVRSGQTAPAGTATLAPAPTMGWADGGAVHVDRGAYSMMVRLPAGTALETIEVAPPCVTAVEPLRGWSADAVADAVDVAATVVKAIDAESALPPAAPAIEVPAEAFHDETVAGSPGPRRAVVFVDLPEAGLYTISVQGLVGGGQGWHADACRKAIVCAPLDAAAGREPGWITVMTAPFNAGRHVFTVTLREGAAVERLRAERKRSTGADYVATLRRLGLDVGETGPVSRAKAGEAEAFVRQRAALLPSAGCGDLTLPDAGLRVAGLQPASLAGPGLAPGESGVGPNPVANPAVPLDFVAAAPSPSPTTPPSSTPPSAPPASPPPSPPQPVPTPSVIPPQPPGSGVTPTPPPL